MRVCGEITGTGSWVNEEWSNGWEGWENGLPSEKQRGGVEWEGVGARVRGFGGAAMQLVHGGKEIITIKHLFLWKENTSSSEKAA